MTAKFTDLKDGEVHTRDPDGLYFSVRGKTAQIIVVGNSEVMSVREIVSAFVEFSGKKYAFKSADELPSQVQLDARDDETALTTSIRTLRDRARRGFFSIMVVEVE